MRYLMLHGFSGAPESLAALAAPEGSLSPALAGHAGTPPPTSFWDEVERLAALCGDRPGLFGYSLGGRLALGLLARYPARFAHSVIVAAHPGLTSEAERSRRRRDDGRLAALLREQGIAAFVDVWEKLALWDTQQDLPEALRSAQRAQRLRHDPETLAQSLTRLGLAEMPDLRPLLRRIATPVELLVGELDQKFVALAHELSGIIPHARLHVEPGAGHNLVLERSELCSERLLKGTA
jgi:2-succinyl-6-hydroxy-2,4-cyclohexadiene-1-carboxylate synthase